VSAEELTWRLLYGLQVAELRLEGADLSDRTAAVARLRTATREGSPESADHLFTRLAELAGTYAPAATAVTESKLRRDLSGNPLARSTQWPDAWSVFDRLATSLRDRTGFRLSDSNAELELERAEARGVLLDKMATTGATATTLVVHGEPDVGKSALTLRVAEGMGQAGTAVTVLSLRDLPPTAIAFEGLIGGPLADVFGATAVEQARLLVIDGAESALEGRVQLLNEVATSALSAGLGVVAVTRTDGKAAVIDALARATAAAGGSQQPHEYEIP
jgi:hypothetical protein